MTLEATRPDFGSAAKQAIATWRFEVPRRAGIPVDALARIPIGFTIKEWRLSRRNKTTG
jgi:hypothetical protein